MTDDKPATAVTLAEAAKILGISTDAVRQRVQRKTLRGYKGNRGRLMVFLPERHDGDTTPSEHRHDSDMAEVERLRLRVGELEAELAVAKAVGAERASEIQRLHALLSAEAERRGMVAPSFGETLRVWLAKRLGVA